MIHFLAKKSNLTFKFKLIHSLPEKVFQIDTLGIVEQTKIAKK